MLNLLSINTLSPTKGPGFRAGNHAGSQTQNHGGNQAGCQTGNQAGNDARALPLEDF